MEQEVVDQSSSLPPLQNNAEKNCLWPTQIKKKKIGGVFRLV